MEFLGTFLMVYLNGMNLIQFKTQAVDKVSLAISTFVVYALLMWCGKSISGSQYNPCITVSLIISKHTKWNTGLILIFFQLISSIFAISMLKITNPSSVLAEIKDSSILGYPIITMNPMKAILLEAIGTFFLVVVYYALLLEKTAPKNIYGLGIGAVVFVDTLFLYGKTGCSLNPLRNLAYALIGNNYNNLYVFLIGPLVGGALGGLMGSAFLTESADQMKARRKKDKNQKRTTVLNKRMSVAAFNSIASESNK